MGDNDSIQVGAVKRIYAFLAGAALCNSIIAVFVASLAILRLLSNQHNAFARSAAEMMLREVPLFFLAVRVHYVAITVAFPQSPARCENLRSDLLHAVCHVKLFPGKTESTCFCFKLQMRK
ncbi:MAG: hypothetical protein ACPIOQ_56505 [Promethearchaeia archaeon]